MTFIVIYSCHGGVKTAILQRQKEVILHCSDLEIGGGVGLGGRAAVNEPSRSHSADCRPGPECRQRRVEPRPPAHSGSSSSQAGVRVR